MSFLKTERTKSVYNNFKNPVHGNNVERFSTNDCDDYFSRLYHAKNVLNQFEVKPCSRAHSRAWHYSPRVLIG